MFDYNLALSQLTQSANPTRILSSFIGAKNFAYDQTNNYVSFRFASTNGMNYCKVKLAGNDTYTIELGYIRGFNYTVKDVTEGLYCDMLKEHFETTTGLYLSFN